MFSSTLFGLVLPSLLLLTPSTRAASCRDLTITQLAQDSPNLLYTTNFMPIESIICPTNAPNGTCNIPRGQYTLNIERHLNITDLTAEEEDSIFALAREAWINRAVEVEGNADNKTVNSDAQWITRKKIIDTTDESLNPDWFVAQAGHTLELQFLAFARSGRGFLGGCDNETLNGMGVRFDAPYLIDDEETNGTSIAGELRSHSYNTSRMQDGANAAGRVQGGYELLVSVVVGTLFALLI